MTPSLERVFGLLAIPLVVVACQQAGAKEHPQKIVPTRPLLDANAALLDPIQVGSLTLTPIIATDAGMPKHDVEVLTLDEAFTQKVVAITEQGSVNNLTLTNKDQRPLFMLAGEVIIGGKQDRIIGQNTVIAGNTTQSVPVFCVEHGRWGGSTDEFTSGKALAHGRLRGKANFAGQQAVWNEVSEKNAERKTTNATDTYRDVAAQQSNGTLAASETQIATGLAKIAAAERARMIGYIVALNGKVATVDRFSSPRLFTKLENKLVRSYLTESVDVVAVPNIQPPTTVDVQSFMSDADKATQEPAYESSEATTAHYLGKRAAKAQVDLKPSSKRGMAKSAKMFETYQVK